MWIPSLSEASYFLNYLTILNTIDDISLYRVQHAHALSCTALEAMLHRCFDWNGKCAGQRICYVSITRMSRHVCVCNVYISSKRTMAGGGGVYARVHARNETPPGATQRHLSAHLQTHHQQLSSAKHLLKHQIFNVNALLIW